MAKKHQNKYKYPGSENNDPQRSQKPVEFGANSHDISPEELKLVQTRAEERNLKPHFQQDKDKYALAVREGSMADNPDFETYAKKWEQDLGILAYQDHRAKEVVGKAAKKALAYIDTKAAMFDKADKVLRQKLIDQDLTTLARNVTGSGSVGKEVDDIRIALDRGSMSSQFAHVSAFINHVLKGDMLDSDVDKFNEILEGANIKSDVMAIRKSFFNTTKAEVVNPKSPIVVNGDAQNQGQNRTKRHEENESHLDKGTQSVSEMREKGLDISDAEVKANLKDPNNTDTVQMVEGKLVWAMNERNKWVREMRQLSLPLAAGVSGTTARMTKGLEQMGVGEPDTRRLCCIGYLIPYHHHSLIEIMAGASGNGGPQFKPSKKMYRDIAPYTEEELSTYMDRKFPDEAFPETE